MTYEPKDAGSEGEDLWEPLDSLRRVVDAKHYAPDAIVMACLLIIARTLVMDQDPQTLRERVEGTKRKLDVLTSFEWSKE